MKRFALLAALVLCLIPSAAGIAEISALTIEVSALFVRSSSVDSSWEAEYTDADGNPATENDWVRLTLTAQIVNGSSQPVSVSWQIPEKTEGVTALTPEAMERVLLDTGEALDVVLSFSRDPGVPLPEGGLRLEYIVDNLLEGASPLA